MVCARGVLPAPRRIPQHQLRLEADIAIFLWHWIYGYFLGTVYCPKPREPKEPVDQALSSAPEAETIRDATAPAETAAA